VRKALTVYMIFEAKYRVDGWYARTGRILLRMLLVPHVVPKPGRHPASVKEKQALPLALGSPVIVRDRSTQSRVGATD